MFYKNNLKYALVILICTFVCSCSFVQKGAMLNAEKAYQRNDYATSLKYLKSAEQYDKIPENKMPDFLLLKANSLEGLNKIEDAKIVYQQIINSYSNTEQSVFSKKKLENLNTASQTMTKDAYPASSQAQTKAITGKVDKSKKYLKKPSQETVNNINNQASAPNENNKAAQASLLNNNSYSLQGAMDASAIHLICGTANGEVTWFFIIDFKNLHAKTRAGYATDWTDYIKDRVISEEGKTYTQFVSVTDDVIKIGTNPPKCDERGKCFLGFLIDRNSWTLEGSRLAVQCDEQKKKLGE
jgi:hypothetical protein